jgi:Holliday junction resolvase RusA-like endonuclease
MSELKEFKLIWKGHPVGINKRYGIYRGKMILSKDYRQFKSDLLKSFYFQYALLLGTFGKSEVEIEMHMPRCFDIDALHKPVFDCLQEIGIIDNDNQIAKETTYRDIKTKRGEATRIEIVIKELTKI